MMDQPSARAKWLVRSGSRSRPGVTQFALGKRRRGSLLAEVAMAAVVLVVAMTLTVKVLGWVAARARASGAGSGL